MNNQTDNVGLPSLARRAKLGRIPSLSANLPVYLALAALAIGGLFLLHRADEQARDTIRKHHTFDLESALLFAQGVHGTVPPYGQTEWCGSLHTDSAVRQQIEEALRQQNELYANAAKPFPQDPLTDREPRRVPLSGTAWGQPTNYPGYFYWKKTPDIFELYAQLENDDEGSFSTGDCPTTPVVTYNYGLNSALRTNVSRIPL